MYKKMTFLFSVAVVSIFVSNYFLEEKNLPDTGMVTTNLNASSVDTSKLILYKTNVQNSRGKALSIQCTPCHGTNFEKKALGKSNVLNGMTAAKIETALQGYKAGILDAHGNGKLMKGQVGTMSDADIKTVAVYIAGRN